MGWRKGDDAPPGMGPPEKLVGDQDRVAAVPVGFGQDVPSLRQKSLVLLLKLFMRFHAGILGVERDRPGVFEEATAWNRAGVRGIKIAVYNTAGSHPQDVRMRHDTIS